MLSKKHLSFTSLRKMLSKHFHAIKDYRQDNKISYRIHDIIMSSFACMYFQVRPLRGNLKSNQSYCKKI